MSPCGHGPRERGWVAELLSELDRAHEQLVRSLQAATGVGDLGCPFEDLGLIGQLGRDLEGLVEVRQRLVGRVQARRALGGRAERSACLGRHRTALVVVRCEPDRGEEMGRHDAGELVLGPSFEIARSSQVA